MAGSWIKLAEVIEGAEVVTPLRSAEAAAVSAGQILTQVPDTLHLRAFAAVRRHLSFSLAADDLGLGQPAISKQVQALESTLGVRLFNRTKPKLTLTEEGRMLSAAIETHMGAFGRSLHEVRAGEMPVRLHAEDRRLARSLAAHLPVFERRCPGHLSMTTVPEEADVIIGRCPGAFPEGEDVFLFADEWVVVSGPAWPRARDLSRSEVALERLMVRNSEEALLWQWFLGTDYAPDVELMMSEDYHAAIAAGAGVALINAPLHQKEMLDGTLIPVGRDRAWTGSGVWASVNGAIRSWDRSWALAAHLQRAFASPSEKNLASS